MMTCENCGNAIPTNSMTCPNCGAATQASRPMPLQPGYPPAEQNYTSPPSSYPPLSQSYPPPQQSYMPPQPNYPPLQPGYPPPQPGYMQQQPSYPPSQQSYMPPQPGYRPQPGYMPQPQYAQQQFAPPGLQQNLNVNQGVNLTVVNNAGGTSKSNAPVIVEVLLTLFFGIYGVGWLMAGEVTTGIILLICSFVFYWPILIAIAVFSLGFGLLCDFPLWITVLIINAVLLNNALKRRASHITVIQTR